MFKHILFPTDTSDKSNAGLKYAMNMAMKYGGHISILNIHEEFMDKDEMHYLRIDPNTYKDFMKKRALRSREAIEKLIEKEEAQAFSEIVLRQGKPRETIIKAAEELEVDVIVMSSNGRSNLKEALIGSVAEYVVRHSKIPVLVVK